MRFCHPFPPSAISRNDELALADHPRIGANSSVQFRQPHFAAFSPHIIFLRLIAPPTRHLRNLTEFPFGLNFSKLSLEGL